MGSKQVFQTEGRVLLFRNIFKVIKKVGTLYTSLDACLGVHFTLYNSQIPFSDSFISPRAV